MRKNSRARREEEAKARSNPGPWPPSPAASPTQQIRFGADEIIAGLIDAAPTRIAQGDQRFVEQLVDQLCQFPAVAVRRAAAGSLTRAIVRLWEQGWQPAEVVRQARRHGSASTSALTRAAIAADHARRASAKFDPRWIAQLTALDLPEVASDAGPVWIETWAAEAAFEPRDELREIIELLTMLRFLPRLELIIAPPTGTVPARSGAEPAAPSSAVDRALLDEVRALLVAAESTNSESEADGFTAQAHELLTRHAVDSAMVENHVGDAPDAPITIRVAIDDPYVKAKSLLLHEVAAASRCRSVFHEQLTMSSVVGFATDVAATEMLYTSLLVQAQCALAEAAKQAPARSRPRSRSFRAAFLLAYANRIGQRLEEVSAHVVADVEATSGRSIVPVLRERRRVIDDRVDERYGEHRARADGGRHDPAAWASGLDAADRAQLPYRPLDP